MDEEQIASELKGNTLRVYWYLLRTPKNSVGPRQIQRKLGFSSPALAVYHLDKLVELGLAKKVTGEYHISKMINVGVLREFVRLRGFIIPRYVLYATLFATLLLFYLSQFKEANFYSVFALIFGFLGTLILWYETIRVWRSIP